MERKEFILKSFDGFGLSVKIFETQTPNAAIQVVHGMSEHQERYEYFAEKLTKNGYAVITSDLRGHGGSIGEEGLRGHFGNKDGADTLIRDQAVINTFIKEKFPQLPVFMFAHSMGSLIARNYIQNYDSTIQKLILSGAPCYRHGCGFACVLCKTIILFSGETGCNRLIKSFAPGGRKGELPNEWLSYNKQNVEAYNEDAMCGFPFTNAGYLTLYELDRRLHQYENYKLGNPALDILFLAGGDDPVTGGEKGLKDSSRSLRKAGYKNIAVRTYSRMRHEILNEEQRDTVIGDAILFFDRETGKWNA